MQSSFNQKFSVEIICMILSHLPSIEVARNSCVCKHWNEIINDKKNKSLWKDASYLEKEDTRTPFELANKRLKILLERSGGTLNHLNIQINTSADFKAQMSIIKEIPSMNLYSLRLVLKDRSQWKYDFVYDHYYSDADSSGKDKFSSMQLAIQTAIANCTDLKSLVIEDIGHFLDPGELKSFKWELLPFHGSKLEAFTLKGYDYEVFMREDMLLHILSQARIIKVQTSHPMPESFVIRLMDAAKNTLEECHFGVHEEQDTPSSKAIKKIIFPSLIKFSLNVNVNNYFDAYEKKGPIRVFQNVSFDWPKIQEIALEGQAKIEFYKRLLPPSLESLRLGKIYGIRLKQIMSLFSKQNGLKKLSVGEVEEDTDSLLYQMLLNIPHIPLEELEITLTHGLHGDKLIDFIKQRRDNPHSTPIKRLYVSLPPKMPEGSKAIKWLEKNVQNFNYDRSSPQVYRR